jgi:putative hemolysin
MNADSSIGLLAVVLLIAVNGLLSAAHAALVNIRKQPLRDRADDGDKRAKRVLDLAEDATRLLNSRQFLGILLRYFAAGILTLVLGQRAVETLKALNMAPEIAPTVGYLAIWVFGALLMLLFGELIPTAVASTRPDGIAFFTLMPMSLLIKGLSPVTRFIMWLTNGFVAIFGSSESAPYVTEEEIKTLVDAGQEEGSIEDDEKEMIYSVFQFNDRVAREIMVPRIDVVGLDVDATLEQALDLAIREGHSRIPLYEGSIDKIAGLLYVKDLLILWKEGHSKDRKVREIMRPAYFVPESKKAGSLLEELQQRKSQIAIVVDEYGGTAGLLTIEDLVEQIVGEIQDEYDPEEEADYEKISDNEYVFDAGINLDEVMELLDVTLPDDENDTLGGYVLQVLDRVPLGGEVFTDSDLEFKVESVTGRRVRKVRVKRLPEPDDGESKEAKNKESKESNGKDQRDAKPDRGSLETLGDSSTLRPDTV